MRTPPHPITGATELKLDPLELVLRLCEQIPAPRQHQVRYYGWYANRTKGARRVREATQGASGAGSPATTLPATARDPDADSPAARARRRSWGRLLRHIYEVDPLLCPQCKVQLKIVAVIPNADVVDRILRHVARKGGADLFEQQGSRVPPAA